MKKLLACTAIAGSTLAVTTAHAQSSVTLYGRLDSGLLYQGDPVTGSGSKFSLSGGGMDSSIFGMLGSEDLGGGYKAFFKIEGSFSSATGVSTLGGEFGRESRVGIDTPYGAVSAGLQYTPLYIQGLIPGDAFGQDLVGYIGTLFNSAPRGSNSILYQSKNVGGFVTSAMYAFGNVAGNFQAARSYSGAISYLNGPVRVNAAYWSSNDATGVVTSRSTVLSGSYQLGHVGLYSAFQMNRADNPVAPGVSKSLTDDNAYSFGVRVPMTYYKLIGQASYLTDERPTPNAHGHALFLSLGFEYFLSKSDILYASVGRVFNKGDAVFSTGDNTSAAYGQTAVSVGFQKKF